MMLHFAKIKKKKSFFYNMSKEEFPFFVFQLRDDDQNGMVVANFVISNGQWFTLTIYGNFLGF